MTYDQITTLAIKLVGFAVRVRRWGDGYWVSTRRLDLPNKPTYSTGIQPHWSIDQVEQKLKQLKTRSQIRKS